jgi:hypothetical protein
VDFMRSLPSSKALSTSGCNLQCKAEAFLIVPTVFLGLLLTSCGLARPAVKIQWKENERLLSVTASHAPLSGVLREIARQTAIELEGEDRLQEQVSIDFSDVSLIEGLRILLEHKDYALVGNAGSGGRGSLRLLMFSDRTLSSKPDLKYRNPSPSSADAALADPILLTTIAHEEDAEPDDRAKQLAALETSSQLGDTEVLQKAILDPDLAIQKASFEALAASDPAGAVDSLLRAAHSDNADMRVQAIELLVEVFPVDPGSALSALRGALADKDSSVKAAAIQALTTQGGAEATALLRQALHDSDPSERLLVIQSVAQTAEGLPLLQEASSDMDEAVRAFASAWLTPPDSEAN